MSNDNGPVKIYAVDVVNAAEVTEESRVYSEQRWACPPPAEGTTYKVLRDDWSADYKVRTIFEWAPA